MGIFGFVRNGVQDMLIQRPDEHKDLVIYKHPENTIPHYAQLTADADEAAVFFRDGALVGTLRTAGVGQRHTLSSQNIPFLGRLLDQVTGGNIFVTDLYFVTTKPMYDQRFGGTLGSIEDPMLGEMITPRINGSFSFQITDPQRFIVNFVGLRRPGTNEEVMRWVKQSFMTSVKTVMGRYMDQQQVSFLQLMGRNEELAREFEKSAPDLDEIGVKVLNVAAFDPNLDDADKERLEQAQAEIGAAKRQARIARIGIAQAEAEAAQRQFTLDQDLQQDARYTDLAGGNFMAAAAGKAMIGAGQGMAQGGGGGEGGSPMMAGAGMGAGFGMAQAFAGAFQQQQPRQAPAPESDGKVSCPGCNARVPAGKFCAECGNSLSPQPKFCPSCGSQNGPGSRFCSGCGTSLPD